MENFIFLKLQGKLVLPFLSGQNFLWQFQNLFLGFLWWHSLYFLLFLHLTFILCPVTLSTSSASCYLCSYFIVMCWCSTSAMALESLGHSRMWSWCWVPGSLTPCHAWDGDCGEAGTREDLVWPEKKPNSWLLVSTAPPTALSAAKAPPCALWNTLLKEWKTSCRVGESIHKPHIW